MDQGPNESLPHTHTRQMYYRLSQRAPSITCLLSTVLSFGLQF
jgi:hypothetical protein